MISKSALLHALPLSALFFLTSCGSQINDQQSQTVNPNSTEMVKGNLFTGIAEPCAKSENYQQAEWIDKNDCSWALEKQLLRDYPEYGKRENNTLKLQLDNGSWKSFSMVSPDKSESPYYHQWKAYYPKAHYGSLWNSVDSEWMAVITNKRKKCNSSSVLLKFSKAGVLKEFPLNLGANVNEVGWSKTHIFGKMDAKSSSQTFQKLPGVQ